MAQKNGFEFKTPSGALVGEAKNLAEFRALVKKAPLDSLSFHLDRGDFIKWLMYTKQPGLAARVRKVKGGSWDIRGELSYALVAPRPRKPVKRKPAKKKKVVKKKVMKKALKKKKTVKKRKPVKKKATKKKTVKKKPKKKVKRKTVKKKVKKK